MLLQFWMFSHEKVYYVWRNGNTHKASDLPSGLSLQTMGTIFIYIADKWKSCAYTESSYKNRENSYGPFFLVILCCSSSSMCWVSDTLLHLKGSGICLGRESCLVRNWLPCWATSTEDKVLLVASYLSSNFSPTNSKPPKRLFSDICLHFFFLY